ncbi:restriction endonuclease subunit S [Vibrio scophthalmi]|uniref:restriction endonuclease subunit S n=1 Tax=Vibrio scophthalmi TaxID=45658 RepID=UPI00387379D4
MSNLVSDGWKKVTLNQVVDRIRTIVNGEPENVLTISSTGGWVDQRQKWARDMAGESLKKYTHLEAGELSYNRGNSKTYPYGCVFKLKNWTSAAVPNVYHSFRTKEDMIDASFIEYAFHSGVFDKQLSQIITSSARANGLLNITAKDFFDLELLVPPLPEQKKIAAILTSVDDVIEKTQAQIDKLKDLKTGMMQELLTRGVGVDGKPHTEFKDSPVGSIPKGWEVRYLADCCSKMTNGYVGSTRDIYVDKGVDYVLCQNVRPNVFVEKTHKYVRQEFHQKNMRACLQEGDVLTVQTGAGNGDTCVVPKSYEGANCHALIISRPKKEILNPYFLAEYMNSDQGKQRVSIIATGGAHPHLNTTDLRREIIPFPPIEEQNKMVNSLRAVQKKYILLEDKKKKLEATKKALMQDLLTGKVRVKVDS